MLRILALGGPVMYVLLVVYLVALAIIIERAIFFYITRCDCERYRREFFKRLKENTPAQIEEMYVRGTLLPGCYYSPISKIVYLFFDHRKATPEMRDDLITVEGTQEIAQMERYLWVLGAIGTVAPLLGLLGTITGLIGVFHTLQLHGGIAEISMMAGGIWEAMLTTAFGLIIAIPALLFLRLYETIVGRRTEEMQYTLTQLKHFFEKNPQV